MNNDPLKHFMKKGDTGPPLRRTLIENATGLPLDLTGASAKFIMTEADKQTGKIDAPMIIETPVSSGVVRYDWAAGDTDTPGDFPSEIQVTLLSGEIVTFPSGQFEPGKSYIFVKITADLGD